MEEPRRQRIAVAIIEQGDKFLISQRKGQGTFPGLWELPGGKCRAGEEPAVCVVREVNEETGLYVLPVTDAVVVEHSYPGLSVEIHAYSCRVIRGRARARESQAIAWISWEEIDKYQFPEANRQLFAQIKRARL